MIDVEQVPLLQRRWASLRYVIVRSLRGMAQSLPVQVLSVTSIAVAMVLLGVAVLAWQNAQGITERWGLDVPVTVYLIDGIDDDEIGRLEQRLRAFPPVARVDRIAPAMALERLSQGLGGEHDLVEGIDANLLPTTLEIHWHPNISPAVQERVVEELRGARGVDEVAATGEWVRRAADLVTTLRQAVFGLGVLVGLSCLAIVHFTIRLGVFSRRAELEILALVGGSRAFVSTPFLIEGFVQGAVGTGCALGLLWLGFSAVRPVLDAGLSLVLAGGLRFFSVAEVVVAVGLGGALGVLGSRAAVARHVDR